MSELKSDESPRKSGGAAALAVALLLFVLLAYPLSVGPLVLAINRFGLDKNSPRLMACVAVVYAPCEWLAKQGPVGEAYMAYVELCANRRGDVPNLVIATLARASRRLHIPQDRD